MEEVGERLNVFVGFCVLLDIDESLLYEMTDGLKGAWL